MCAAAVGLFSQIHGVDAATCNADLLAAGVVWQNGGNCEVVPAGKYHIVILMLNLSLYRLI